MVINRLVCKYSSHKTSWNNMAFRCITTCSNFLIISRTEYSFLSQQSAISVRKSQVPVPKPDIWTGLGQQEWRSRSIEQLHHYLGNRIWCIFRQPLKYLCFSYSFLDGVRKCVEILNSPIMKNIQETTKHVSILEQNSTNAGLSCGSWWCHVWIASGVKRKDVSEVLRKHDVCVKWDDVSGTTTPRHKSRSWNFLCKIGARNRNVTKTENYKFL